MLAPLTGGKENFIKAASLTPVLWGLTVLLSYFHQG